MSAKFRCGLSQAATGGSYATPTPELFGQGKATKKSYTYILGMSPIFSHVRQVWVNYFGLGRLPQSGVGKLQVWVNSPTCGGMVWDFQDGG